MKIKNLILLLLSVFIGFYSCKSEDDDGITNVELRDRSEQYIVDIDSIEQYLATHFFNYEEFEADPNSTSFKIEFDTIAGSNSDKTSLIDQLGENDYLRVKTIEDSEGVEYNLYFLKVREGGGEQPTFADSTFVNFVGDNIYGDTFDSSINPLWIRLPQTVQGFRETVSEFRGSSIYYENGDGTFTFEDYGIGAIFIPSGLGYFNAPQAGVPPYSPLIFTFQLFEANDSDDDNDGVLSLFEDIDGDRDLFSDDTDEDLVPNFLDADDDGDNILTIHEDLDEDGDPTNDDSDNDGIPNYLDSDSTDSNQDS